MRLRFIDYQKNIVNLSFILQEVEGRISKNPVSSPTFSAEPS